MPPVCNGYSVFRMKERARKAGAMRKEEEEERKSLQVRNTPLATPRRPLVSCVFISWVPSVPSAPLRQAKLGQTEAELRSLSKEFQGLRSSLAQRDTSVLQLQSTISTLTQKLTTAHRKEVRPLILLCWWAQNDDDVFMVKPENFVCQRILHCFQPVKTSL